MINIWLSKALNLGLKACSQEPTLEVLNCKKSSQNREDFQIEVWSTFLTFLFSSLKRKNFPLKNFGELINFFQVNPVICILTNLVALWIVVMDFVVNIW